MSTSYSISDNVSSSLRADASVPVWTSLNERTLSDFRKKQLITPYQIVSSTDISFLHTSLDKMLDDDSYKETVKRQMISQLSEIIKQKTTFTRYQYENEGSMIIKARTYVFSEKELLEFIDRCRE
jgi:hypothetical protein